ncbi:hypothetical protein ACHAQH_008839 [Verticillium albo-atrum]
MRVPLLAVFASLAIDCVLGSPQPQRQPSASNFFAGEALAHEWSASRYKQLRVRALAAPSPSSSTSSSPLEASGDLGTLTARLQNVTEADLRQAREIVEEAIEEAAALNQKRFDNPRRNRYQLQDGTKIFGRDERGVETPPLLTITDEIAEAAALVAEADVFGEDLVLNGTMPTPGVKETRQSSDFWMETIKRRGSWPWGKNPPEFKVFRNVKDYGAKGDGKTDDTKAIRKAIEDSPMCGDGCYSSTTHGAIIYFPSGTYLISSTIEKHYGTQLIGNPNNRPIMKAAKFFVGLGIFSTNKYYGDDQQDEAKQDHAWHINTGIFWGQIRNFVIDISGAYKKVMMTGIHYQVSQATSLQYVDFKASTEADAEQRSIYGGNQQFTGQRITFKDCRVAVQLIWDWGWTWKSIVVDGSSTAFKLVSEDGSHGIGGALIVDSVIKNTKTAVAMFSPTKDLGKGTTGLTLDNVKLENVQVLIDELDRDKGVTSVRTTKVDGGKKDIDLWILGRSYQNNTLGKDLILEEKSSRIGALTDDKNPLGLLRNPYFERAKPQYEKASVSDFVSTKGASCKGDGKTDDTSCIQSVIDNAAMNKKIVFVDAGTYIITDTINVPPGSRIVGENWAQLAATGSKFKDESVGKNGQKGTAELQDLIFTSKGETPGAVFVEWNLEAEGPGKAALWDCHVRVGGTDGSGLTSRECPPSRSGVSPGCKGGSLMMHLTPSGSAYLENAWLWVADHDLDDPSWTDNNNKMTQTSIYVARGMLVESTKPTWMYGTSSEHSVYYQYEFFKSANVLAGMIQTEQPYYQPTPKAPAPFEGAVGVFRGDPPFRCTEKEPCDSGWGLRVIDSRDITILGAGLYSWFSTYAQDCLTTKNCQKTMAELSRNRGSIVMHNVVTIGAVNMFVADGKLITAKENQAVDFHPYWSQLSRFEAKEFKKPVEAIPVVEHGDGSDSLERMEADLSTSCSRFSDCVDLQNPQAAGCGSGWSKVGYDESGCGSGYGKPICCKTSVAPSLCTWRANLGSIKSDCNGRCWDGEVNLYQSSYGGGDISDTDHSKCGRGHKTFCWGRHRSLCCTPNLKEPAKSCGKNLCESEPFACPSPVGQLADGETDPEDEEVTSLLESLERRGERRPFNVRVLDDQNVLQTLILLARLYYGPAATYGKGKTKTNASQYGFREDQNVASCGRLVRFDVGTVLTNSVSPPPSPDTRYSGYGMDHAIDLQYMRDLTWSVLHGLLTSGEPMSPNAPPIDFATFEPYWNDGNNLLPIGMRRITPTSPKSQRNVNARLFEVMGATTNRAALRLLDNNTNEFKGRVFKMNHDRNTGEQTGRTDMVDGQVMERYLDALIAPGGRLSTATEFLTSLRSVIAVWRYVHHDDVLPQIQQTRRLMRSEINHIEDATRRQAIRPSLAGFTAIFDEFDADWWEAAADHSRTWIEDYMNDAEQALDTYRTVHGEDHPERAWIEQELQYIWIEALRIITAPPSI